MAQNEYDIRRNELSSLPRFAAMNAAWIEDLHQLEESDNLMINHPEIYTQNGSNVFTVHIDGEVAGACALKRHEDGRYELTKMAVDPKFQGRGIGQALMTEIETFAKDMLGLKSIFLLSSTKNEAALRLYERNGWVTNHEGTHPIYNRCNIGMEKQL